MSDFAQQQLFNIHLKRDEVTFNELSLGGLFLCYNVCFSRKINLRNACVPTPKQDWNFFRYQVLSTGETGEDTFWCTCSGCYGLGLVRTWTNLGKYLSSASEWYEISKTSFKTLDLILLKELRNYYCTWSLHSFTLGGIPYAPVMFLYALRKKLLHLGKCSLYSLLLNSHQGKNFHWSFKKNREMTMTRWQIPLVNA